MTYIWTGPPEQRGRATRSESRRLVPSQFTERYQAGGVPKAWPVADRSAVERACDYCREHRWPAVVMLVIGCGGIGFVVACYGWAIGELVRQ